MTDTDLTSNNIMKSHMRKHNAAKSKVPLSGGMRSPSSQDCGGLQVQLSAPSNRNRQRFAIARRNCRELLQGEPKKQKSITIASDFAIAQATAAYFKENLLAICSGARGHS